MIHFHNLIYIQNGTPSIVLKYAKCYFKYFDKLKSYLLILYKQKS